MEILLYNKSGSLVFRWSKFLGRTQHLRFCLFQKCVRAWRSKKEQAFHEIDMEAAVAASYEAFSRVWNRHSFPDINRNMMFT